MNFMKNVLNYTPFAVCSIFGFFDALRLLCGNEATLPSTHPSGFRRFEHLMESYESRIDQSSKWMATQFNRLVGLSVRNLNSYDLTHVEAVLEAQ